MQTQEEKLKLKSMKLDIALSGEELKMAPLKRSLLSSQILTEAAQRNKIYADIRNIGQPTAAERKESAAAEAAAKSAIPVAQDKIALINSLISSPGLNSAVGPTFLQRIPVKDLGGAKSKFISGVNQLVNKETIDTLLALKAKGGTLGALSDQERILLQSAATKIGSWAVEKDGKVIGYKIDQRSFIEELNQIKKLTERAVNSSVGSYVSPTEKAAIQSYISTGLTTPANFNAANYF